MENSTTSNNFGLFQTWEVKKTKLTENSSCSNEILPEDRFKNLQLNSVAKSEMSVEYEIKEQKIETNINPYSNTSVLTIFCLIFYEVLWTDN